MAITRAKAEELDSDVRNAIDFLEGVGEYLMTLADEDIRGEDRTAAYEELQGLVDENVGSLEDLARVLGKHGS